MLGQTRECYVPAITRVFRILLSPSSSLHGLVQVCVFFPDPWGGKYDEGRRIVRDSTLALLAQRVRAGGRMWIATDVEEYAEHVRGLLADESCAKSGRRVAWGVVDEHRHAAGERRSAEGEGSRREAEEVEELGEEREGEGIEGGLEKEVGKECWEGRGSVGDEERRMERERARKEPDGFGEYARPVTKYEAKAREDGRPVWEFLLRLQANVGDYEGRSSRGAAT